MSEESITCRLRCISDQFSRLRSELSTVFIGQDDIIEQVLIAIIAGGHVLLSGVPGLGKTTLVKHIAALMAMSFRRIQFTPDLMPADIIGGDILQADAATGERFFQFQPGPIFSNIILADEINRTPPKTQSALLEAMGELQVTVSGATRPLPQPFIVLATQNPVEQSGTYPLPEAQLDRFLLNPLISYLTIEQEMAMVTATTAAGSAGLSPVFSAEALMEIRSLCREVIVPPVVVEKAVRICAATRPGHPLEDKAITAYLRLGAGSRASQALILAGKARAILHGHANAAIEDLQAVMMPVLRHRLFLNFKAVAEKITADALLQQIKL